MRLLIAPFIDFLHKIKAKMNDAKQIVNAKRVYQQGYFGEGVRIAVLDTGACQHIELKNRIVYFRDLVHHKEYPYDDNGHGTHVAGILCATGRGNSMKLSGMAPKAELIIFKVLDSRGNGRTEDVIRALEWIKANFIQYRIRLINFSMGFLPNSGQNEQNEIMKFLEELWDLGVCVVTAAGNNGPGNYSVTVPGISKKVITVGSCDDAKIDNFLKRGYSGKGPTDCCIIKPEVLAPGTNILSLNQMEGYTRKSGSSMATPIVCGALALCYDKNPNLTPSQLKLKLFDSCEKRQEKIYTQSWGLLNVDRLVECV